MMDLISISPKVMEHHLHVFLVARLVKHNRRPFDLKKDKVIQEEVQRLLEVEHIQEVYFSIWLSNVVLVPSLQENDECVWTFVI